MSIIIKNKQFSVEIIKESKRIFIELPKTFKGKDFERFMDQNPNPGADIDEDELKDYTFHFKLK